MMPWSCITSMGVGRLVVDIEGRVLFSGEPGVRGCIPLSFCVFFFDPRGEHSSPQTKESKFHAPLSGKSSPNWFPSPSDRKLFQQPPSSCCIFAAVGANVLPGFATQSRTTF